MEATAINPKSMEFIKTQLTPRVYELLTQGKILTYNDFITASEEDFLAIPHLGVKTFTKIQHIRKNLGYPLPLERDLSPELYTILKNARITTYKKFLQLSSQKLATLDITNMQLEEINHIRILNNYPRIYSSNGPMMLDVPLSPKVKNALIHAGILTIDDFKKIDMDRLKQIKFIGEKGIQEIKEARKNLGCPILDFTKDDIITLPLPTKVCRALQRANITTVKDFISFTKEDFLQIRRIAEKSIDVIAKVRESLGYPLT